MKQENAKLINIPHVYAMYMTQLSVYGPCWKG